MAKVNGLVKSVELQNSGYEATYWVIGDMQTKPKDSAINLTVHGYKDKTSYADGKSLAAYAATTVTSDDFADMKLDFNSVSLNDAYTMVLHAANKAAGVSGVSTPSMVNPMATSLMGNTPINIANLANATLDTDSDTANSSSSTNSSTTSSSSGTTTSTPTT